MVPSRCSHPVLEALRDVEGVRGSFVLNQSGQLVARDLPADFDPALFAVVGPRVVRFYGALTAQGEAIQHVVMRFSREKLQIRPGAAAFLCVLCDLETNAAALNMAMALAARGLPPELAAEPADAVHPSSAALDAAEPHRPLSATLPSATVPEVQPDAPAAAATPARAPITYRGRRLG